MPLLFHFCFLLISKYWKNNNPQWKYEHDKHFTVPAKNMNVTLANHFSIWHTALLNQSFMEGLAWMSIHALWLFRQRWPKTWIIILFTSFCQCVFSHFLFDLFVFTHPLLVPCLQSDVWECQQPAPPPPRWSTWRGTTIPPRRWRTQCWAAPCVSMTNSWAAWRSFRTFHNPSITTPSVPLMSLNTSRPAMVLRVPPS